MFFIYIYVKTNWSNASISFTVSLFSFCFLDLSIEESGMLKSPTIIVLGAMCALSFSKVSFMNEGTFAFGAYMLRIESPSWSVFPLTSKKCPSVSLLMTLG